MTNQFITFLTLLTLTGCFPRLAYVGPIKDTDTGDSSEDTATPGDSGDTADTGLDSGITTPARWYADSDGDAFGDTLNFVDSIEPLDGYVANDQDCNDADASINPEAVDGDCNGVDNNCDGNVDEAAPAEYFVNWYLDSDEDGYGDPVNSLASCAGNPTELRELNPTGDIYVDNASDCAPTSVIYYDDEPDSSVDCMDPDDDGTRNRGDTTPIGFVPYNGQSIDNMSRPSDDSLYGDLMFAIGTAFETSTEDPINECWAWHNGGDYGTFRCTDTSKTDMLMGTIPTDVDGDAYTYAASFWLRHQTGSQGFAVVYSDPCQGENLCGSPMGMLYVDTSADRAYLMEYSSSGGLYSVAETNLIGFDFDGDGMPDGNYGDNVWYTWSLIEIEGTIIVQVVSASVESATPVTVLSGPGSLSGGNVGFLSINGKYEVHQATWANN